MNITSSTLIAEIRDVAKLQQGKDVTPNTLATQIVPVIDVNPKHARIVTYSKSATNSSINSSVTMFTTDAVKETFITHATLSFANSILSEAVDARINVTLDDLAANSFIMVLSNAIGGTGAQAIVGNFGMCPIKLKKNSTVVVTITGTATGVSRASASVAGFMIDNPNA